ncbi:hypothetical protein [Actinomadura rifamycini]|uniref:hypothetical protein n=1 Tax=Actinomadura rifamycini TaxID=31962 RepID=UPI00040D1581|nr:hypothetical protein [Actinomadura rifamycini]
MQEDEWQEDEWQHAYAALALRLDRLVRDTWSGTLLIYRGPAEWSAAVDREEPPPPARLADDADRLLDGLPFGDRARAGYLAAHVRALRAVARRLAGDRTPLPEYARACLGVDASPVPESSFAEAHDLLDAALPARPGSLADRLHAWRAAHALPPDRMHLLPGLVLRADAECRARTAALVPLPPEEVDCRLASGVRYRAAGHHDGGPRSTIFVNRDLPFNLADLLYVVAHEGHPGHIAESLLKEVHLIGGGRPEQRVRFMIAPSFVVSEGLGLHAQEVVFPGGAAQAWLEEHVLAALGIRPDGSDFAAVHRAVNLLWGAWANAALLADEGRPDAETAAYLSRWALLDDAETAALVPSLHAPAMGVYVLGYHHGHRILDGVLTGPDRRDRLRRLLTEQVLPGTVAG